MDAPDFNGPPSWTHDQECGRTPLCAACERALEEMVDGEFLVPSVFIEEEER